MKKKIIDGIECIKHGKYWYPTDSPIPSRWRSHIKPRDYPLALRMAIKEKIAHARKAIGPIPMNEIDPLIRKTIIVLNQKGYKTIFSCQGHYADARNTQVVFPSRIKLPKAPLGFAMETRGKHLVLTSDGVRHGMERKMNDRLLEWAMTLPKKRARKPRFKC